MSISIPRGAALAGAFLIATLTAPHHAAAQLAAAQLASAAPSGKPTLAPLLRRVTPSVVNIAVTSSRPLERASWLDDPALRRFFDLPEPSLPDRRVPHEAAGSGVIVDAAHGYVLTNHHVVEDADEIVVTLADRRRMTATLVGSDEETDVALLKIDADNLTAIELGDSDKLEVGDFVIAIGNPFGLGQAVTSGIVSALGRGGFGIERYEDFIQTDASINPGNSGGALVDLDGKLVGINSAMLATSSGGNVGIGFAVPSNMAKAVMQQLAEHGEVRRGRLGVMIQDLTPDLAAALGIGVASGALLTSVEPGSSAERAGLVAGDVVTAISGTAIQGATDLRNRVGLARPGETIVLGVLRDNRSLDLRVQIVPSPRSAPAAPAQRATSERLSGAEFDDLKPGDPQYRKVKGVLVTVVATGGAAWRSGLRAGDVIVAVNRREVTSVANLTAALRSVGQSFALNILRDGARLFIVAQ